MKRRLSLLVLALAASVSAQDKSADKAPAPPQMSAEGKKFVEAWRGNWNAPHTVYTMGDHRMEGSLKMNCEAVSSGWGTLCRGVLNAEGMPPSEGTFLMAWDIATAQAHMFEVADSAEVHDHSGKWTSDKSVSLVREGKVLDGKVEKDACTATFVSPTELTFDCVGTQAGAPVWKFTSRATK